ncbi:ankyrin repeat domain-containing protein [uncultured Paludibaculum sp.]|uniref:ankyrin repeat domain-containing protein n=1 Tax=uncultured Paludibaculum sp. TaxID=1765020 RepID=UPI002AAB4600|nr:ankyrin repeat domain-containing protein [uncultured Paludibaculum sp.]
MTAIEAIKSGDLEALKAVLAADASAVDERDENGVPAAMLALYFRQQACADALLDAGTAVDLPLACALGLTEEVVRFVDADPGLLSQRTSDGWTPLHLAAFFGQLAAAGFLLSRGADPLARSTNKMANLPIHAAAATRQAAIVEMLLDAGTPANATQHGGYTALHSAAQNGDQASMNVLLRHGGDMNLASDDGKTPAQLLPGV